MLLTSGLSPKAKAQVANRREIPLPDRPILQEQKVVPSDGTLGNFGLAVALDGSTALIGAPFNVGGAAYVYTESNGIWSEAQRLTASDGKQGDSFGLDLDVDGDTLVVAAPNATVAGGAEGAVYVFQKQGDDWVQSQKLSARDGGRGDRFGGSVRLSGRALVVGADGADIGQHDLQGAAYVFVEANGVWRQVQKLTGSDSYLFDHFGTFVAIDGSTILVSAPNKVVNQDTQVKGEVYVFALSNGVWTQTQNIIEEEAGVEAYFGASLAIDHGNALIGARFATVNGTLYQGAAYIFAVANGVLTQTQMITASDGASNDDFGVSVALSGNIAMVGADQAPVGGHFGQGKAYAFRQVNGTWNQVGTITASDGFPLLTFGAVVALDGDTSLIGDQQNAAYFYSPPVTGRP